MTEKMREVKFRQARHDSTGKFREWFYWGFIDGGFIAPIRLDVENYQYIGTKNGVEIYEGDITNHGIVEWDDEAMGFLIDGMPIGVYDTETWPLEVLGNKYKNPELLKNGG